MRYKKRAPLSPPPPPSRKKRKEQKESEPLLELILAVLFLRIVISDKMACQTSTSVASYTFILILIPLSSSVGRSRSLRMSAARATWFTTWNLRTCASSVELFSSLCSTALGSRPKASSLGAKRVTPSARSILI